jgi:cytochrome b involved in lipid metabolism
LVLLGEAGSDATKAWEEVQHSDDAKELMKDYLVGYCPEVSPKMIGVYFQKD